jgi:microcystin-dependent protein
MLASTALGTTGDATSNLTAQSSAIALYRGQPPNAPLSPASVGPVGGSQPHTNFQPYLCVSFIISLFGIFPSAT